MNVQFSFLKLQHIFSLFTVFFSFFSDTCAGMYTEVFQVGAICKKKRKRKIRAQKKEENYSPQSVAKVPPWHTSIRAEQKIPETQQVFLQH